MLETKAEFNERAKRRYPIEQSLRYRVLYGKGIRQNGEGRTVDMSSKEVTFTTASELPEGGAVELTVEWPALLHDSVRMKLMLFGVVMRGDQRATSVAINRHEFRTQRAVKPV